MPKKKKKVFVGMSGGVDSSVTAALLKKAGFEVVGIYMKCWVEGVACTTPEDERSARLAAQHLGIPFYVWSFLSEYKEKVVEYMLKGYRQGITPNPDIMCNREVKFGMFFEKAMKLGADYIATGHYARLWREAPNLKSSLYGRSPEGRQIPNVKILKAKDPNKDQSYFLAMVKPEVLDKVLFPIGEYTKPQVRTFAKKIGLPNAERKDSQGICFVGKVEIGDFLRLHIPQKEGVIVSAEGEVLGKHDGAHYYTLGQRQGLRLAGGPYYVAKKDIATNTLQVTKQEEDMMKEKFQVKGMNWFSPLQNKTNVSAKFRYRQKDVPVEIEVLKDGSVRVVPEVSQRAITPGQFAVFYQEDELLGGGVIV